MVIVEAMNSHILTFGQFAALAKAKRWSVQRLAEQFRGKIESPADFSHRLLDPRNADAAIPYRSVLEFYQRNASGPGEKPEGRSCACGCDRPVSGRKKLATGYCRVKMARRRSVMGKSGAKKATETKGFSVINAAGSGKGRMITVRGLTWG